MFTRVFVEPRPHSLPRHSVHSFFLARPVLAGEPNHDKKPVIVCGSYNPRKQANALTEYRSKAQYS